MRWIIVAAAIALSACTPAKRVEAPAIASGIDCAKATALVEKAICADPALIKLDGEIGAAYSKALALYAEAPAADAALRDIQRGFNLVREASLDSGAMVTLTERLEAQRLWIGALQKPRDGFVGDWGNLVAEVAITQAPDGALSVEANAAEASRGAWLCDLRGTLTKDGDGLKLTAVSKDSADLGGWTVRFVRDGAVLKVIETPPANAKPGDSAVRPYCGMNGGFEGAFLPVDKALYQLP
jgi:uncharacterized protein YecT (DUF1311 family)